MTVRPTPDYQPYVAGSFRWRLALRPLDVADWIQIGDDYDHEMDMKAEVLRTRFSTAVAALPGSEVAGAEVLLSMVDHLVHRFPEWFERVGDTIVNHHRGEILPLAPAVDGSWSEHPLAITGRLVQEDMAILVPDATGRMVFGAGAVCFPNRWDLRSKLGLTLTEVHAPVAKLNEQLERPIDDFFTRLSSDRPFWRLGWGVLDTDDLYQPLDGTASVPPPVPAVGAPDVADRLFLRVERETIRRFESCVLFTIRTYIRPLRHLAERPDDAERLADALANLPDDVAEYKKVTELSEAARHWLTSLSTGGGSGGIPTTARGAET